MSAEDEEQRDPEPGRGAVVRTEVGSAVPVAEAASVDPVAEAEGVARRAALARRLYVPLPGDRLIAWTGAILLTLITFVVRVVNLTFPDRLLFDEAYYVPEAEQYLRFGFEENRNYYFIVHPPFGKMNIAVGEWIFGYNPTGWRFSGVVLGSLAVLIFTLVTRRLTRSTFLGFVGGILFAADGFSFAISRTGILDVFLQFYVLAGLACLVVDRDQYRRRLATAVRAGPVGRWGPNLGFRWWRLAAGILLGLSCSVKWSGAYFLAAFAILTLLWDWGAYRIIGLSRPALATLRRSLPSAFWDLGIVPVLAYLATWIGWFMGETAQGRHWAEGRTTDYPWIPEALRSMWHMQGEWLKFHNGLSSPHPYESNPWSWLVSARPVLFNNDRIVGADGGVAFRTITMIGTPPLWWAFIPATLWMGWWVVSRRDWRAVMLTVAIAAGWGSWLLNTDRTMFMFYMAPVLPFFILAVVFTLGDVLGSARASDNRRQWGVAVVAFYVALVVIAFVWFLPVLNGTEISEAERSARIWLSTWG